MSGFTNDNATMRIERVLRDATRPLPTEEVSRLSGGVSLSQTSTRLRALVGNGRVRNVGRKGASLYIWSGPSEDATREHYWRDAKPYTGEKPSPVRPGSLDFLTHGSVEQGQWKPRTRPVLISSRDV